MRAVREALEQVQREYTVKRTNAAAERDCELEVSERFNTSVDEVLASNKSRHKGLRRKSKLQDKGNLAAAEPLYRKAGRPQGLSQGPCTHLKPSVLEAQAGAIITEGIDYGKEPVFDIMYEARIRSSLVPGSKLRRKACRLQLSRAAGLDEVRAAIGFVHCGNGSNARMLPEEGARRMCGHGRRTLQ